jgi:hypothetical protein
MISFYLFKGEEKEGREGTREEGREGERKRRMRCDCTMSI